MPHPARASPAHIASLVRAPLRMREGGRFLAPLGITTRMRRVKRMSKREEQHHSPSFQSLTSQFNARRVQFSARA